jgi:hypothetical protein
MGVVDQKFWLAFGYTHEHFVGHAVVVHNSTGTPVACGLITNSASNAAPMIKEATITLYPGYNGTNVNATGKIQVWDLDATRQVVNYQLSGLGTGVNTTGGLHIHVGVTCDNASIHYYSTASDPWLATNYTANTNGVAQGSFIVTSGYLLADNIHHAVVIHESDNNRLGCGLLDGPMPAACPQAAIQDTFMSCKVYDFTGVCSDSCATSVENLVAAFANQSATVASAQSCLDMVNAVKPWENGAVITLKDRINFDGDPVCNVTAPGPAVSGVTTLSSLIAVTPLFLFF